MESAGGENMDFEALEKLLNSNNAFALMCHINPDGDAVGAVLALGRALAARGKSVTYIVHDGVPGFLKFIVKPDEVILDKSSLPSLEGTKFDAVVMLDCATKKRAGEIFFPLMDSAKVVINIDHHVTNHLYGQQNFIDGDASSTCEILHRFFTARGWPVTRDIADCLYLGIMYDTGRFIHSNTTPAVFRICSELVAAGVNPSQIANSVYNGRTLAHLRMIGYALDHMQTAADNRVVWVAIPRSVYAEMGASDPDLEGIVELLGGYEGCEVHLVFTTGPDGLSRASTRSTGRVKVNEICKLFNGGGHDYAAGLRIDMPLEQLVEQFVAEVIKRLP